MLIFWPNSSNISIFVLSVKIVPIIEADFDRYVLSKVGIVMLFCIYCHLYMCFVTLLAGGNKEIYLSILPLVEEPGFKNVKYKHLGMPPF